MPGRPCRRSWWTPSRSPRSEPPRRWSVVVWWPADDTHLARTGPLSGRWTSRRGRDARAQALRGLADDLRATVTVALTGARRSGESALAEALRRAPVSATVTVAR